jgi:hypothetical protein
MRVMTRRAGLGPNRIPAVRLLEGFLLAVMARETKLRIGATQEIFLVGTVGKMAGPAARGLKRFMDHLLFELLLRMARVAEVVSRRLQQVVGLGCVGVMAERTLAVFERGVDVAFVRPSFSLLAGVTDLIPVSPRSLE